MHKSRLAFLAVPALLFVVTALPVRAQDRSATPGQTPTVTPGQTTGQTDRARTPDQSPTRSQDQTANMVTGQLVRVDTTAKTIAIRNAQGTQMTFEYNDNTKVTGAGENVAGLATMAGTQLTIHYTKQDTKNVATMIDVQKASDTQRGDAPRSSDTPRR